MDDEKIIQEQGLPNGDNLEDAEKPEAVSEPFEGGAPADEPPGGGPVSDETVHDTGGGEPVPEQKADEPSNAGVLPGGSGADAELLAEVARANASVSKALAGISGELHELHRLYHNEFAGRLKSMQEELDRYHDADRGNAFDGILGAISRIYVNNESLPDEISDPKLCKNVKYMLLDLSDLLEEYGVLRLKSEAGGKRNVRHCQIVEQIPTDDPEKHDTIAKSRSTGFYKGNRTIIKELVEVYFFDKRASAASESDTDAADAGPAEAE